MNWVHATAPAALAVDWVGLDDSPVDPYLIWFDYVGLGLIGPENFTRWYADKLPVLLELNEPFGGLADSTAEVPAIYNKPIGRNGAKARFVSARVAPKALGTLFADPRVKRIQLELSRIPFTERGPTTKPGYAEPFAQPPKEVANPQTWLGVIDIGCAFAHENYRAESQGNAGGVGTRVRYLWDQSPTRTASANYWREPAGLGYGAELGPTELDFAMADFESEAASYAKVGSESVLDTRAQHGFGVLDLAASRPSPLVVGPPPLEGEPDAAGALPVVFVQLDSIEERVTNINSLGVHVLDGLRWMIERVENDPVSRGYAPDPAAKLVVNISYGGLAGPHDGSSILERAIDELIETRKNLFVVLAAGNSHDPDLPTHARLPVKKGQPGTVLWQVEPDDPTDGFLELWFPAKLAVLDNGVRVRVTAPDCSTTEDIHPNQTWMLPASDAANAGFAAGAMFRSHAANGEDSAMFLLAVQSTALSSGVGLAQAGLWKVEVMCQGDEEMDVHAWLERDDYVSGNLKRKQQSSLIDPGDQSVSLEYGFSSMAHGEYTVVAGGYCLSDSKVSEDTASGPSRRPGSRLRPDASAPSDESRASPGLLVAGATTGVFNRMSGTSAAAPSVARWIANWCAAVPGAVDFDMLKEAMRELPGDEPVPGAEPGPEAVPGSADEAFRRSRILLNASLKPELPAKPKVVVPSTPK